MGAQTVTPSGRTSAVAFIGSIGAWASSGSRYVRWIPLAGAGAGSAASRSASHCLESAPGVPPCQVTRNASRPRKAW
ncbi:hypothetical protein AB0C24_13885 [Amycolatopsis japonica]|uniref:hypothetical protein n=1 Tax=Amycolatopsis japonica TaxID=208439 RepID=UPI0033C2E6CD